MNESIRIESTLKSKGMDITFDAIFKFGSEEYEKSTDKQKGEAYQIISNKGWTDRGIKLAILEKFDGLFDKDMIEYIVETVKEFAKLYPLDLKKEPVELIFKNAKSSES
jgi:hypothetical protein